MQLQDDLEVGTKRLFECFAHGAVERAYALVPFAKVTLVHRARRKSYVEGPTFLVERRRRVRVWGVHSTGDDHLDAQVFEHQVAEAQGMLCREGHAFDVDRAVFKPHLLGPFRRRSLGFRRQSGLSVRLDLLRRRQKSLG